MRIEVGTQISSILHQLSHLFLGVHFLPFFFVFGSSCLTLLCSSGKTRQESKDSDYQRQVVTRVLQLLFCKRQGQCNGWLRKCRLYDNITSCEIQGMKWSYLNAFQCGCGHHLGKYIPTMGLELNLPSHNPQTHT